MTKEGKWMTTNSISLEDLKEYLSKRFDIQPEKISMTTSLLYDLELKGDDIDDLFSSLGKDFKINVKRLNLSRFYVGDEPMDFISPVIRFIKKEDVSKKPTITIGDVINFINTGILE
jgi:hypothetical protein